MSGPLSHLRRLAARRAARFRRDGRGSVSIETVIIMPVLIFTLGMTVLLSDMFRSQTISLKAAYTVADTLSRRVDPVDGAYLDGMETLYRLLADASHGVSLRVSSIAFDNVADLYIVIWSYPASGGDPLTTETLNKGMQARLPSLPPGETVILVETGTQWRSFLPRMFPSRDFVQVVFTRPRFTSQLRFDTGDLIIAMPGGNPTCDDGSDLCDPGS